jgi:hypothetical protein
MINTAKGQRKVEEMANWMDHGFSGSEDLTAMFRKFYGLDRLPEDTPDYSKAWKEAADNFQKSFKDYLDLIGVVPMGEHLKLIKKHEEMKKRFADQEATIKHLRMLLDAKGVADQTEVVKGFQGMMEKQSKQFQELTESFGKFFKKEK